MPECKLELNIKHPERVLPRTCATCGLGPCDKIAVAGLVDVAKLGAAPVAPQQPPNFATARLVVSCVEVGDGWRWAVTALPSSFMRCGKAPSRLDALQRAGEAVATYGEVSE